MDEKVKSSFNKNVLTLLTGTTIAQAIPIAITPILTRIYTPSDFGTFAVFVAITSIFSSISSGRYEMAIMLPKKEENAIYVLALGFILTTLTAIILLVLIVLFQNYIITLLNNEEIRYLLYIVPASVFFMGIFNLLNYYYSRKKHFKTLANANILRSVVLAIGQLFFGFFVHGGAALVSGQIFSQVVVNLRLLMQFEFSQISINRLTGLRVIAVAKKYKKFPQFSLAAILANTLSQHLTSILISSFYAIKTLGFYSLVQRMLAMPFLLIGGSIGQVFYQEAAQEKKQTGTAIVSFKHTLIKLIIIGVPVFLSLFFIVEDLFSFIFGKDWAIAGHYAQAMIPLYFIRFIVSPLTLMNQVNLKNRLDMFWQIGLLLLYVIIILMSDFFQINFYDYLLINSLVISLYYVYLLYLIYQHSKYSTR